MICSGEMFSERYLLSADQSIYGLKNVPILHTEVLYL